MPTTPDENFFSRWSRLKRQPAAAIESADATALPVDTLSPSSLDVGREGLRHEGESAICDAERKDHRPDAELEVSCEPGKARDYSDFDFTKLDFQSDYTEFMRPGVPQDARNKALRQLWDSNPALTAFDGLDDCFHDYTDAATVPAGGVATAYRIGRGFLSDSEVAEWEALGRPQVADAKAEGAADAASTAALADGQAGEEAPSPSEQDVAGLEGEADIVADDAGIAAAADADGACLGAACGVAVKLEDQAALDEFEAQEPVRHPSTKPGA